MFFPINYLALFPKVRRLLVLATPHCLPLCAWYQWPCDLRWAYPRNWAPDQLRAIPTSLLAFSKLSRSHDRYDNLTPRPSHMLLLDADDMSGGWCCICLTASPRAVSFEWIGYPTDIGPVTRQWRPAAGHFLNRQQMHHCHCYPGMGTCLTWHNLERGVYQMTLGWGNVGSRWKHDPEQVFVKLLLAIAYGVL